MGNNSKLKKTKTKKKKLSARSYGKLTFSMFFELFLNLSNFFQRKRKGKKNVAVAACMSAGACACVGSWCVGVRVCGCVDVVCFFFKKKKLSVFSFIVLKF